MQYARHAGTPHQEPIWDCIQTPGHAHCLCWGMISDLFACVLVGPDHTRTIVLDSCSPFQALPDFETVRHSDQHIFNNRGSQSTNSITKKDPVPCPMVKCSQAPPSLTSGARRQHAPRSLTAAISRKQGGWQIGPALTQRAIGWPWFVGSDGDALPSCCALHDVCTVQPEHGQLQRQTSPQASSGGQNTRIYQPTASFRRQFAIYTVLEWY